MTALWPVQIGVVGLADLASMVILMQVSRRGAVLAALYGICAVINAFGALGHLPTDATYAILEPIGWLMLAVLGNVDSGLRGRLNPHRRLARRRDFVLLDIVAKWRDARNGLAVAGGEDKR